ncbi:transmembrane protein, putative (macronuclear) [Tetrahymena thermophila SB210]|uniref:Transmembrane protein, putative n=1 Tax=Tetrahymena thermophila (strain SB210) TaxID=312017 RepID=Q23AV5_TETTS|nr:transmembrane protein, putative [Tetrahymena thermophila SB210]EAR93729.2 transmembrane protein, putative [Tetrahymena thermophila SB210]|eukprot:XP_001013974.2 transmembrane protein, putative [Tetrahymena thermophila SB210]
MISKYFKFILKFKQIDYQLLLKQNIYQLSITQIYLILNFQKVLFKLIENVNLVAVERQQFNLKINVKCYKHLKYFFLLFQPQNYKKCTIILKQFKNSQLKINVEQLIYLIHNNTKYDQQLQEKRNQYFKSYLKMNIFLFSILLIQTVKAISFPQSSIQCPTFLNKAGHPTNVQAINYIPNSIFFASGDSQGRFLISNIKTGQNIVYQTGYTTDTLGIQSIASNQNGDILVISQIEYKVYNVYSGQTLLDSSITTNAQKQQILATASFLKQYINSSLSQYLITLQADNQYGITSLSYIDSNYQYILSFQITISSSATQQQGISDQPSQFLIIQDASGILKNSQKKQVLLGISTSNLIYGCDISNSISSTMINAGVWQGTSLNYPVNAFTHLQSTTIIAIMFGQAQSSPGGSSPPQQSNYQQNSLVFFDLQNLQGGVSTYDYSLKQMISTPSAAISISASNLIKQIKNIFYNKQFYVAFVYTQYISIYNINDLISNNYNLFGAIQITFQFSIQMISPILIQELSYILVASTNGNIISFDFSSQISSAANFTPSTVNLSSFNFQQYSTGITSDITNGSYDDTDKQITLFGTPQQSRQSLNISYSFINLSTSVTQVQTLSFANAITFTPLAISSTQNLFILFFKPQQYLLKINGACPTANQATESVQIAQIQLYFINISQQKTTVALDFSSKNIYINQIVDEVSFSIGNANYVAFIFDIKFLDFTQYCLDTTGNPQKPPGGRILQQYTANLFLYIYDSKGHLQYQSPNPFLQLQSMSGFIDFISDSNSNLVLYFNNQIIFLQPQINNGVMIVNQFQILSNLIQQKIQTFNTTIKTAINNIISFYFIPTLNQLFIQFNLNDSTNYIYSSLISYSATWQTNVELTINQIFQSQSNNDSYPYQVSYLEYKQDTSLLILKVNTYLKVYSYNLQNYSLQLYLTIDKSSSDNFFNFIVTLSTTQLLIVDSSSLFQIVSLNDCESTVCDNSTCEIRNFINQQPNSSSIADYFKSDSSGYILRQEALAQSKYSLLNSMLYLINININYNIYVQQGSLIIWNQQYTQLDTKNSVISNYLKKLKVNLNIQSVDYTLNIPQNTYSVFNISIKEQQLINTYNYVQFQNVILTQNAYASFFQVSIPNFIMSNTLLISKSSNPIPLYVVCQSTGTLLFQNTVIQKQYFNSSGSLFYINSNDNTLILKNITFQNNIFYFTNLIYSIQLLNLQMDGFNLISNTIRLKQTANASRFFISAQIFTLNQVSITSNILENVSLIGINSYTTLFQAFIDTFNFIGNTYLMTDQTIIVLIFDGQTQDLNFISALFIKSSNFRQLNLIPCSYDQYQTDSCSSVNIDTSSSNYIQIALSNTQEMVLQTVNSIDNHITQFSCLKCISVKITQFYCKNTNFESSAIDFPCLVLQEHTQLSLQLNQCGFENKYLQNNYVISIDSSSTLLNQQQPNGYITFQDTYFNTINLFTLTSFYQSSAVLIESYQNLQIQFTNVTYNQILFLTPQKLFQSSGSCLTLSSPFSSFLIQNSAIQNLISYSSSAAFYLNVYNGQITNTKFQNNNYDLDYATYKGGYIEIQSNNFTVSQSNFTNSIAQQGNGLTIVPSQAQASYKFNQCIFQNLIAAQNGAAVYINQALNLTTLQFNNCIFTNILSSEGGGIYLYFMVSSKNILSLQSTFPTVIFNGCTTSNLFSIQGGLAYIQNSNLQINDLKSRQNNPNLQTYDTQILNYIKDMQNVGEYITLQSSIAQISLLNLSGFQIFQKTVSTSDAQTLILKATSFSITNITNSYIDNCIYYSSAMILIQQSTLNMAYTNITNSQSYVPSSTRMLTTDITTDIQSQFSAIMIVQQSTINLSYGLLQKLSCNDSLCSGGALAIFNSQGSIINSVFDQNLAQNNGGSLQIINLSNNITIKYSNFTNSQTIKGFGGGLSFITNQDVYFIVIDTCFFNKNFANQGGGAYFEIQSTKEKNNQIVNILNTKIQGNTAQILGGGIFYQGQSPYTDQKTVIMNNVANSTYGQNSFSYPKKIILNKTLSQQYSNFNYTSYIDSDGNQVYQIQDQVSGVSLPNLVFQLLDENNLIIDSSYTQINPKVVLDLSKKSNNFVISSSETTFSFQGYFNVSNLIITGIPGTSVYLILTSSSISSDNSNGYQVILEIQLRQCIRGEIFSEVIQTSSSSTQIFYKCVKCSTGTYSLAYPNLSKPVTECSKCSQYAQCPGGDQINVDEGYWRINDQSDQIIQCINSPSNCLGGQNNSTCSTGHTGPLCETCDIYNGYTTAGNFQCGVCGDHVTNSLKILGLMLFYIISAKISVDGILNKLLKYYSIRVHLTDKQIEEAEQNTSVLLKLILSYFQIIMVLTTFQISVPSFFNNPVDVIANPTTQILYSFECFFYQLQQITGISMIYLQLIAAVILPIACLLIFAISAFLSYRDKFIRGFYLNTSFCYCLMYFQPSIFKNAITLISCRQIGNTKYIQFSLLFECYTSDYVIWSLSLVIPVILVVAVFIPLILLILIWRSKQRKYIVEKRSFMFMILEYKSNSKYWEFVKMNMKLLVMCCLTFYEYDIPNKILFILFIVCCYGSLLFHFQPYKEQIYNKVDMTQTIVQAISIYLGFVAYQNVSNPFWWLISILLIAIINLLFVLWAFKILSTVFITQNKDVFEKFKIFFVRFICCRKYFFSEKQRKYYLKRRWLKSIVKILKKKKLISLWSGKLKVEPESVFPILNGQIPDDQIPSKLKKIKFNNDNIENQNEQSNENEFNNNLNIDEKNQVKNIPHLLKAKSCLERNKNQNVVKNYQLKTNPSLGNASEGIIPKVITDKSTLNNQLFSPKNIQMSRLLNNHCDGKSLDSSESHFDKVNEVDIISDIQINEGVNILNNQKYIGDSCTKIMQSQNNSFQAKSPFNNYSQRNFLSAFKKSLEHDQDKKEQEEQIFKNQEIAVSKIYQQSDLQPENDV